jgi:hypothetical protein
MADTMPSFRVDPFMARDPKAILAQDQALLRVGGNTNTFGQMAPRHTSDAQGLAKRIRSALAVPGVDVGAIAKECGITRQAIDGWKKTGRVSKKHLPVLARHTAQSVDFFLGTAEMTAQEAEEVQLVLSYRDMPPEHRQALLRQAEELLRLAGKRKITLPDKP